MNGLARALARTAVAALAGLTALAGAAPDDERPARRADVAVDVRTLLGLAESGDARAAFLLGTRFASGRAGVRDDSEAARWFRAAAEAGLAEGQYNLGILYATGRGVEPDPAEASRWYRLAAEQGLPAAQYNLGVMHLTGEAAPRDPALAARWLEPAARAGLARAQHNLGVLYEHGRGVPRSVDTAVAWYRQAAAAGYEPSRDRLDALNVAARPVVAAARPGPAGAGQDPSRETAGSGVSVAEGVGTRRPASAAAASGLDDYRRWVGALSPERFTVQLISDPSEAIVRGFLVRHFPHGGAGYYSRLRDGVRWYSAVHGDYPTYDDAVAAAATLPAALRTGRPWVRRVRAVHEAMDPVPAAER